MKIGAHVFVSGNVQGVFFRSETKYEANKYQISGWVRNLPDDRVEAMFEGEEEDVRKIVDFCRIGPPDAKIKTVNVAWLLYSGKYDSFEIRY